MCGIIGAIGNNNTIDILLTGLSKLEYRGYDSAGVFVSDGHSSTIKKVAGRINDLKNSLPKDVPGHIGIGHTRWATHGGATEINAHPHISNDGRFVLVHNGVITNTDNLKEQYLTNIKLQSETDSEIIVQLLAIFAKDLSTEKAIYKVMDVLEGSYALGIIDTNDFDTLYAAKKNSPLIVGHGTNANFIASDAMALLNETNLFSEIMDEELIILTKDSVTIKNKGQVVKRTPYKTTIDASAASLGNYEHFMLKEIEEQPTVLRQILKAYTDKNGNLTLNSSLIEQFLKCDRLYIIACGTSFHAGLIGKQWIEKYTKIPVEVHIASEFAYFEPLLSSKPLFLFISQSGETADSRQALQNLKYKGYPTIVLTNVDNSTLVRETDDSLLLHAGPEIAVASTKAYTAQLAVLAILAKVIGEIDYKEAKDWNLTDQLTLVANILEDCISHKNHYKKIAKEFLAPAKNAFFLGRGKDYSLALEAALKIKEIAYLQAEGYAAGELKHGPIALIEDKTPVILLNSETKTKDHSYSNAQEVKSRGANVLTIATQSCANEQTDIILPDIDSDLAPFLLILVCQYLAYYTALAKDLDVDKPRNLAKSVTVE